MHNFMLFSRAEALEFLGGISAWAGRREGWKLRQLQSLPGLRGKKSVSV